MIPVESFAADTTRIEQAAAELKSLDQAWTRLAEEFASLAAKLRRQHDEGLRAEQDLAKLMALDAAMVMVERAAINTMTTAMPLLGEAGGA